MKRTDRGCPPSGALPGGPEGEEALAADRVRSEASRCLGVRTCEACDVCRLLCPDLAITRDPETGQTVIDLAYCKGCGICAAFCPRGAIRMVVEPEEGP